QRVFDTVSDLIALLEVRDGPRFTYVAANRSLLQAGGWNIDDVVGHDTEDLVSASIAPTTTQLLRDALASSQPLLDRARLPLASGTVLDVEFTLTPIRNERHECTHLLWVARDVSRQLADEQAIRASEARWRAIVRSVSDVIAVLDQEGNVRYASPASERLLG